MTLEELAENKEIDNLDDSSEKEKIPFKEAKSILENTIGDLKKLFKTDDFINELKWYTRLHRKLKSSL
ncbi:MAG: hypothetical protein ACNI3H_11820 [Halarcobacter ebronensis]